MDLQNPSIFLASIVATGLMGIVTYIGWLRRNSRGGMAFFWMTLAALEWVFAYALEALSGNIATKIFWSKMQYLGIASVSVLWFLFASYYSESHHWLRRRASILIWVIPAITFGLVLSNEFHYLVWTDIIPNTVDSVVIYRHGTWFWIHTAYSYMMLIGGTFLLVQSALRSWSLYRYQSSALLLSAMLPWIGNVIYVTGLVPIAGLDITPFSFALTGLVLTWGLYGLRLFDLVPVARDVLFDNMKDGFLVLDAHNRIIDLNTAAARMLNRSPTALLGQPAEKAMVDLPELLTAIQTYSQGEVGLELPQENTRCIDLQISPLLDHHQEITGRLVELRDITDRKAAEEDTQENETRFRLLLENAPTGILVADSLGMIQFINTGVEEIFGYSSAELLGKPVEVLLPQTARTAHVQLRESYRKHPVARKMVSNREIIGLHKDGGRVSLEIGLSYLQTRKDFLITAFILDVTERKHSELALRESEARNRSMIASLAEGVVLQDVNGAMISCNAAAERILGLVSTQTSNLKRIDALWQAIREDGSPFLPDSHPAQVTLRTGQRCSNVIMGIQRTNQDVIWVSVNSEPLVLPGESSLIGVVSTYFDITERKKMEEKLVMNEQAERQFSLQVAALQEISVILLSSPDLDDMCRKAIELGRHRLGFDRLSLWFLDPSDPAYLLGSFGVDEQGKIRDERSRRLQINTIPVVQRLITREDSLYYDPNQPLRNERFEIVGQGEVAGAGLWDGKQNIGCLVMDNLLSGKLITEHQRELLLLYAQTLGYLSIRKRAEQALRESERRYRMLADNAADVVWTLDLQGYFVYVSPSVERLLGLRSDGLVGQSIDHILAEPTNLDFKLKLQEYTREMSAGQNGSNLFITDVALQRPDGSLVWTEVVSRGLFDEQCKPMGLLSAARDISAKREADQLRNDMTHMMVHDLRNPLSSISTAQAALLHGTFGSLSESQVEVLHIAQSSSNRMMQLINDILDINRLESRKMELDQKAIYLKKMVDDLIKTENSLAGQKKITLENKIQPELPPAFGDAELVRRIVQNLVGNALKFTPQGGIVQVAGRQEVREDRSIILVSVQDNGAGIPTEVMDRLFQKFVIGKQQERGSGLGLTFCKLAVEAHGERIWAENHPDGGAVFTFSLPVAVGESTRL